MRVTEQALRGDVRRAALAAALPSMGAMLLSGAGTLCDALMLARVGTGATAAAALSFPILTLIQAVGLTLGMGAGAAVSRMIGGGDEAGARAVAAQGLQAAVALAAALCASAFALAGPLLALLGGGQAPAPGAALYARCLLLAGPGMCAGLVLSALLRAQGLALPNMAASGLGAAAGAGVQAALMHLMGAGVGAAGAALLVREGVTLAVLLLYIWKRRPPIAPAARPAAPSLRALREIMRSGLPTLARQGLFAVSGAMLTAGAAAFGQEALSGVGLAVRAGALLSAGITGFGQGFAPVCGVCYGAGQMRRVRDAYGFCMRAMVGATCAAGALTAALARRALLMAGASAGAARVGALALAVQGAALPMQGAVALCGMLTQAMGLTVRAALAGASRQGYVLIAALLCLPRWLGLPGLLLAQGVSDAVSLALCLLLTRGLLPRGGEGD